MKLAITPRSILVVLGLVLLALFVLIGGPYIAFADFRPLESLTARLVTILLIVLLRVAWVLVRRMRAGRATDKLMAGVAGSAAAAGAGRPSDEAVQLRERFEEGIAALKQSQRQGRGLYDLPWYAFIGAPGSGKTTALVNSGLKFPLEQRIGKGALRGVGGTRNCDWWFTDEAVFLDTAGRYTTQDSDASADASAWSEFLKLLREYRRRRPLNGVILTISAHDLMTLGADGRSAHVSAARRRLDELNQELRVQLPVYVFVTKCDLVAGFSEYFGDLTAEGRAQVWGVTFSRQETMGGGAAKVLGAELDQLMVRLNERLFGRLEEETDAKRRTKVFGFPQQMAALGPLVGEFVGEVFGSTRFDKRILLRGVYFTSGTQEGTPIDRLLSAIGRRFGMASEAVAPAAAGRGKAFFIESLLKDVLIGESGVAGLNWRQELRLGALQLGAYIAMVAAAVLGVVLLSVSFRANRVYLAEVSAAVDALDKAPAAAAGAPLAMMMPRLNAVREVSDVANRYRADTPFTMRWGLFQGTSVGNSARDAYGSQLRNALLPFLVERIERRLTDYAAEPDKLYEYLKAYLMFGDPGHLDRVHLGMVAGLEAGSDGTSPELAAHLKSLFEEGVALPKRELNEVLVKQGRSTILAASKARLIYNRLYLLRADDQSRALRLDVAAGMGAESVLRFRSGRKLSDPIPGIFTAPSFKEITGPVAAIGFVKEFASDAWVWGDAGYSPGESSKLVDEVLDIYEGEYIKAWDAILRDIEPVPFRGSAEAQTVLATLAAPTSPLRGLLKAVDENTYLVTPPDPATPGAMSSLQQAAGRLLAQGKAAAGVKTKTPGTRVTAHFNQVHQLMAGAPAPIESNPGPAAADPAGPALHRRGAGADGCARRGGGPPVDRDAHGAQAGRGDAAAVHRSLDHADRRPDPVGADIRGHDRPARALPAGSLRGVREGPRRPVPVQRSQRQRPPDQRLRAVVRTGRRLRQLLQGEPREAGGHLQVAVGVAPRLGGDVGADAQPVRGRTADPPVVLPVGGLCQAGVHVDGARTRVGHVEAQAGDRREALRVLPRPLEELQRRVAG